MKWLAGYWLTACVIGADQLSKWWALQVLQPYQAVACCPGLNWTLAFNTGSAFSFLAHSGAWHTWFFLCFALLMSALIMVWMTRLDRTRDRLEYCSLGLILAGALGNCLDRIHWGYVIDFIDLYIGNYHWPVFNLADSAICLGGALLMYDGLLRQRHK